LPVDNSYVGAALLLTAKAIKAYCINTFIPAYESNLVTFGGVKMTASGSTTHDLLLKVLQTCWDAALAVKENTRLARLRKKTVGVSATLATAPDGAIVEEDDDEDEVSAVEEVVMPEYWMPPEWLACIEYGPLSDYPEATWASDVAGVLKTNTAARRAELLESTGSCSSLKSELGRRHQKSMMASKSEFPSPLSSPAHSVASSASMGSATSINLALAVDKFAGSIAALKGLNSKASRALTIAKAKVSVAKSLYELQPEDTSFKAGYLHELSALKAMLDVYDPEAD
jgi:hypothetical protein